MPPGVPLPKSMHWLGDRPAASATQHDADRTGCVMYFRDEAACLKFMQWLTGYSGAPAMPSATINET
jgi:hypothetical protein